MWVVSRFGWRNLGAYQMMESRPPLTAPVETQVQWSGMVVPDSMAEIQDSQPGFSAAFSSALASAVASAVGSLAGSPAQSVVDDDGDETMGESATRRENPTDL